jgi:hypothetical protein
MVAPLYPKPMLDSDGNQVTLMGYPCVLVDFQLEMIKAAEERRLAETKERLGDFETTAERGV